jgi:hypothetical protein
MNTTTKIFLDEVESQIDDAIQIGGERGQRICRHIAQQLADRQIANIHGDIDPADVHLSDEQWSKITKEARTQAAFCVDSW